MRDKNIKEEFASADFGDKRLNRRLGKLVYSLSCQPGNSFPQATGSVAALEGTYRFLGNPRVMPEKILAPHIGATLKRACESKSRVLIAHDTTALILSGDGRAKIGWVNQGGVGFLAHFSLAIARSESAQPLGVVGITPFFRTGKAKGKNPKRGKKDASAPSESIRWWNSIENTQALFPSGLDPIHITDREADDYDLFSQLCEQKIRFIIRIRQNRVGCQIPGDGKTGKLFEIVSGLDVVCKREVAISKRNRGKFPSARKDNQPRGSRIAKLHITATPVVIPRSFYQRKDLPKSITVNCVHIYEVEAPEGVEPINWKLITTEPIKDDQDILNIVDDYRARWIIEEYFKALKTGCAYEKRQLETKQSLINALTVFAPIAWQLLLLRSLNNEKSDHSAEQVLTKTQIEVLRATSQKPLTDQLSANQALLAIATLGGHIPNNGSPGWHVIAKGMEKLLTMEIAWTAARERCDQS